MADREPAAQFDQEHASVGTPGRSRGFCRDDYRRSWRDSNSDDHRSEVQRSIGRGEGVKHLSIGWRRRYGKAERLPLIGRDGRESVRMTEIVTMPLPSKIKKLARRLPFIPEMLTPLTTLRNSSPYPDFDSHGCF